MASVLQRVQSGSLPGSSTAVASSPSRHSPQDEVHSARIEAHDLDGSDHESEADQQDKLYSSVPAAVKNGTNMLKVSAKKVQKRFVRLNAEAGQLLWESKNVGMRACSLVLCRQSYASPPLTFIR